MKLSVIRWGILFDPQDDSDLDWQDVVQVGAIIRPAGLIVTVARSAGFRGGKLEDPYVDAIVAYGPVLKGDGRPSNCSLWTEDLEPAPEWTARAVELAFEKVKALG